MEQLYRPDWPSGTLAQLSADKGTSRRLTASQNTKTFARVGLKGENLTSFRRTRTFAALAFDLCYPRERTKREIKVKTRSIVFGMALVAEEKSQMIAKYRIHKSDSGSPEVQVALLTQRILQLTEHFKAHKQDHHSRRGLLTMVKRRRKLIQYLKDRNPQRYQTLIQSLGIRH